MAAILGFGLLIRSLRTTKWFLDAARWGALLRYCGNARHRELRDKRHPEHMKPDHVQPSINTLKFQEKPTFSAGTAGILERL